MAPASKASHMQFCVGDTEETFRWMYIHSELETHEK